MKDRHTHLAHKVKQRVDLETGAVLAVTLQGADQGDTTTTAETVMEAAEQVAAVAEDEEPSGELGTASEAHYTPRPFNSSCFTSSLARINPTEKRHFSATGC